MQNPTEKHFNDVSILDKYEIYNTVCPKKEATF